MISKYFTRIVNNSEISKKNVSQEIYRQLFLWRGISPRIVVDSRLEVVQRFLREQTIFGAVGYSKIRTVSYTHLDVYKRQRKLYLRVNNY